LADLEQYLLLFRNIPSSLNRKSDIHICDWAFHTFSFSTATQRIDTGSSQHTRALRADAPASGETGRIVQDSYVLPQASKESNTPIGSNTRNEAVETSIPHADDFVRQVQDQGGHESRTGEGIGKGSSTIQDASASSKRKRTRKITAVELDADDTEMESSHSKLGRRSSSTTISTARKGRRSRAPSLPVFDESADPGEDIDPTAITMATLCSDTGVGRVSSKAAVIQQNHADWKAASKARRARMRAAQEAKKYGRSEEDAAVGQPADGSTTETVGDMEANSNPDTNLSIQRNSVQASAIATADQAAVEDGSFDYDQTVGTSKYNVQVRIGPNGEMIVDEQSLFVDRAEDEDTNMEGYTHVEESDATKFVNSSSYSKKVRGSRWSAEETELFFVVCSTNPTTSTQPHAM
jgi:transcription factor TFIIIB component B''